MRRFIVVALSMVLLVSSCGHKLPQPITFESNEKMLSYLTNNKWKNNSDNKSSWLVIFNNGFGEFSNSDDLGYGQFIVMSPQTGSFELGDTQYIISSETGDIVNCSKPQENYKISLQAPDIEMGGTALKNYVYTKRSAEGDVTVSIQLTNTGKRTYKSIGYDVIFSDDNNNSMTLESDYIDLSPGQQGSCSVYSNEVPADYKNVSAVIKNYSTNK